MKTAIETLRLEGEALLRLAEALEKDAAAFEKVVALVLGCKGRVVVSGVGKSGHIGGKIAATLASTGTPAFFVHPTEALHGDLGMIGKDDVVLALSHSGESKELGAMFDYCVRFGIPLVALTGKPHSTLGKAATAVLENRVEKEGCPLGLAPMASTTASLALADALAAELMVRRGFKKEDFAVFHPGGKLGAQLLRVGDIMIADNLPLVGPDTGMKEVLGVLVDRNVGCVGVVDGEALVGVFTDGDLKRKVGNDLFGKRVGEVMTVSPKVVGATALATAGVRQMQEQRVTSLWVVEGEKPVGLFRLQDCLQRGVV